jgi:hypothetical protein
MHKTDEHGTTSGHPRPRDPDPRRLRPPEDRRRPGAPGDPGAPSEGWDAPGRERDPEGGPAPRLSELRRASGAGRLRLYGQPRRLARLRRRLLPGHGGLDLRRSGQGAVRAPDRRQPLRRPARQAASTSCGATPPGPWTATSAASSPSRASTTTTVRASWCGASLDLNSATELNGARICVAAGSTSALNAQDWFRSRGIEYTPVVAPTEEAARQAYSREDCDAFTADISALAAARTTMADPQQHAILADIVSKEPLGPVVRARRRAVDGDRPLDPERRHPRRGAGRDPGQCETTGRGTAPIPASAACWASRATSAPGWVCRRTGPERHRRGRQLRRDLRAESGRAIGARPGAWIECTMERAAGRPDLRPADPLTILRRCCCARHTDLVGTND